MPSDQPARRIIRVLSRTRDAVTDNIPTRPTALIPPQCAILRAAARLSALTVLRSMHGSRCFALTDPRTALSAAISWLCLSVALLPLLNRLWIARTVPHSMYCDRNPELAADVAAPAPNNMPCIEPLWPMLRAKGAKFGHYYSAHSSHRPSPGILCVERPQKRACRSNPGNGYC